MTDGIISASCERRSSGMMSFTHRASSPSDGSAHFGGSDHRSPARRLAISMKHPPVRGDRCLPADSSGTRSGTWFISVSLTELPALRERAEGAWYLCARELAVNGAGEVQIRSSY